MICEISFADEKFKSSQQFNAKMAKKFGADKVIKYGPNDIDSAFISQNCEIWNNSRGYGYWLWKPYLTLKTLRELNNDDYLIYMDAGACFTDSIHLLTDVMDRDGTDIMIFCLHSIEKNYSKRDALVLMEADLPEYYETPQRCATYFLLKKSERSVRFIEEWLSYATDPRIITNNPNVMGKNNYEGFVENRHDQTILSLLSKKWNIDVYRDPAQYGLDMKYPKDVLERSPYLQVVDAHRFHYMPKTYWCYKNISRQTFEKIYRLIHRK